MLPDLPLPLSTPRLGLRNYGNSDATAVAAYVVTADYWQHQAVEMPSAEQIAALVKWGAAEAKVTPRLNYFLAATRKDSSEIVGEAVLRVLNPTARQAEIGFGIAKKNWRHGFATEIGRALLAAAFDTLKMHRVTAQCAPENLGSLRVLQKLGMAREGVMRDVAFARGRWWSSVVMSMLETEYAKIKSVQRGK
ncbi:MAG: GNAT family N-acetyltransferase [Alphaproteobacteria bacterium]|nr:GNAT family N-acetyltransferase [Alphaproteobacteria bacterium]